MELRSDHPMLTEVVTRIVINGRRGLDIHSCPSVIHNSLKFIKGTKSSMTIIFEVNNIMRLDVRDEYP